MGTSGKQRDEAFKTFQNWYQSLPQYTHTGGPALGVIGAALVVLERLRAKYNPTIDAHTAKGGSQVKGVSGPAVRAVLDRFGETRRFPSQGGRTNRGSRGAIDLMFEALRGLGLQRLTEDDRNEILETLQRFLVEQVQEYHARQRLTFDFDVTRTAAQIVRDILDKARAAGKEGQVAQYLVGAKLQLRFPDSEIPNVSHSTSDVQQGRPGDFYFGNTAFHVTVAPMPHLYERSETNLREGRRVYLLVPERAVVGVRQNVEQLMPGRVSVESIEGFVGQNLDELSQFDRDALIEQFRELLTVYNRRVDAVETDKSMLIELPPTLEAGDDEP